MVTGGAALPGEGGGDGSGGIVGAVALGDGSIEDGARAVSALEFQIGVRTRGTSELVISPTGREPTTG